MNHCVRIISYYLFAGWVLTLGEKDKLLSASAIANFILDNLLEEWIWVEVGTKSPIAIFYAEMKQRTSSFLRVKKEVGL